MVVRGRIGPDEAQRYYDATNRTRLTPGWVQRGGQPLPEIEPFLWR